MNPLSFFSILLLIGSLASTISFAEKAKITALPLQISGTLDPIQIVIGGETYVSDSATVMALELNGAAKEAAVDKPRAFQFETREDELRFVSVLSDGRRILLPSMMLPRVLKVQVEGMVVSMEFSEDVKTVSIDGMDAPVSEGRLRFQVADPEWFKARHLLIATSTTPLAPQRNFQIFFPDSDEEDGWAETKFGFFEVFGVQNGTGGTFFSPGLNWNPAYRFSGSWALQGELSFYLLKRNPATLYPAFGFGLQLESRLAHSVFFGAGGGIQSWVGLSKLPPFISARLSYRLPTEILEDVWLDRIYLSYEQLFTDFSPMLFRVGFLFDF